MNVKISGGKVNTWAEITFLSVTDTTVTTMHTSGPSDRSASRVIITRALKRTDGMDSSIEDFKDLNETDTEVSHIVSPNKVDSELGKPIALLDTLKPLDPSTLTSKVEKSKR